MRNLVSIITPAYNAASYVDLTIASVRAQDYQNWELLIVDDGSLDDTSDRVATVAKRDPRIKLIQQPNGGPAAARQRALDDAEGRYIAFLDSDDLWLPNKMSLQLDFMTNGRKALSYTSYRRINADGSTTGRVVHVPRSLDYRSLLKNTAIATSSVIVDRSLTGPFKITQSYYDDFVLWLSLMKQGHIAYGLQEDLLRYRVLAKSVSRNKLKSANEVWRIYRENERLPVLYAGWCFSHYAFNAAKKYILF